MRQHSQQHQRRDSLSSTTSTKSDKTDKTGCGYTPMLKAKSKKKRRKRPKKQSRSGSQPAHAMQASLPVWGLSKSTEQHHRSYSTDIRHGKGKGQPEPPKQTHSNSLRMRTATKLAMRDKEAQMKGQHRLDFNLYGIEVKPARRYRLMDGRIGIAKFKGKHNGTVRGKMYLRCKQGKGDMVAPHAVMVLGSMSSHKHKTHKQPSTKMSQRAQAVRARRTSTTSITATTRTTIQSCYRGSRRSRHSESIP